MVTRTPTVAPPPPPPVPSAVGDGPPRGGSRGARDFFAASPFSSSPFPATHPLRRQGTIRWFSRRSKRAQRQKRATPGRAPAACSGATLAVQLLPSPVSRLLSP
ncbi:hypothetical protein OPV22_019233 [Ensete ventricosum]|uniref:Uncharacterized protein n=1 Tax=Ensete ventricosum TaxID=4639 RepID=A0AAV8P8P8_ENSVE|nr:hypothetical protein OPV22_019233 [Ensete ventricosum]RWW57783.1 hypothetical protein BHE74_00035399 [Ensete ventricosum]RZS15138.1 hypothetical protein BHM03_00046933 [Ensete ventricosum]